MSSFSWETVKPGLSNTCRGDSPNSIHCSEHSAFRQSYHYPGFAPEYQSILIILPRPRTYYEAGQLL